MDTSQIVLNNGLTFLAVATGITVLVVGGFLVKLLFDMSKLAKNLSDTTVVIKDELKPALSELNSTLKSINSITKNANSKVDSFSKMLEEVFGVGSIMFKRAKSLSGGLVKGFTKGLVSVLKMFLKRK